MSLSSDGVLRADPSGRRRPHHRTSNALMVAAAIGTVATGVTAVVALTGPYLSIRWQPLTHVFAVPTALGAAY